MSVPAFIDKFPKTIRSKKTYEYLRTKGISYIRQLSAKKWTDHNIHDPGITILEMICYALTDLGYKTEYAIEDILAESSVINEKNNQEDAITNQANNDTFFTAAEILPSNPVTLNDWRKLIIDAPLVRNAWLIMLEQSTPAIYRDPKRSELRFTTNSRTTRLNIDGLFEVNLEFEEDDTLGDLNSWEYSHRISINGSNKDIKLYFKPEWEVFFENNLDPHEFEHAYLGPFTSIEDTALYSGIFYLKKDTLSIPFAVNIESPLAKTESNKTRIDNELVPVIDEIGLFLKARISKCSKTAKTIEGRIHQHRNLCEDFVGLKQSSVEEVAICTDIEVQPNANIDKILAEIYFVLKRFLSPTISFYSLEEMLEMGITLDNVFNGPVLQHGFIKERDLQAADYKTIIHVSDIIQLLMDIDGIVAIKSIQLSKYFCGLVLNDGEDWCLSVTENHSLKFNANKSKIVFYKGLIPYKARLAETQEFLDDLIALDYRSRLQAKVYDIEIPKGIDYKLRKFHSIQNDFPLVYGIGPEGLALSSSDLRKAQAKQLKAFLKLIDQILANYCAQLAQIKSLFSLDKSIKRTYFSQLLFSLPATYKVTQSTLDTLGSEGWTLDELNKLQPLLDQSGIEQNEFSESLLSLLGNTFYQQQKTLIEDICKIPEIKVPNLPNGSNLIREFVLQHIDTEIDWDNPSSYETEWNSYLLEQKENQWNALCEREQNLESSRTYEERKNRFLDHLLARFGEQFTDYVLLSSQLDAAKPSEDLIEDKINFLKEYPVLSRDRGKGFNYKKHAKPKNVSGLEMRASRLVGINSWQRMRFIADYTKIFESYLEHEEDGIDEWRFRLRNSNGEILFSSTRHYQDQDALQTAMETALHLGVKRKQYIIKANKNGKYFFLLIDTEQNIITRRRKYYSSKHEVEQVILEVIETLEYYTTRVYGFHLVEHMLLRPISDSSHLFKISSNTDCSPGYQDPYTFRVTAVVPYWPQRFQNMDFRRFFEDSLRKEVPAHIHIKICWVNEEAMGEFESVFFSWLKLKTEQQYTHPLLLNKNQKLINEQNKLLHLLENFNSIYPETHLFDCSIEGDSKSILLNQSKLGTNKGD